MKGKVTAYGLNVRQSPSGSSKVVGNKVMGDIVTIYESKKVGSTIWHRIGVNQWVSGSYVEIIKSENPVTPPTTKPTIVIKPGTSTSEMQKALEKSGYTIQFLKGNHKVTKTLKLYSDTTLELLDGAKIIQYGNSPMLSTYADQNKSYNYDAVKNLTICGKGLLYGNGSKVSGTTLSLFHASNVKIFGIGFRKTYQSHAIDIIACKDVVIEDISFAERIIDKNAAYREEIQYDFAYYSGAPYYAKSAKVYNGNHCENITIRRCTFKDANVCIGTHTEANSDKKHKNLSILDCVATGVGPIDSRGSFTVILNVDGVKIAGNIIKNFARGIEVKTSNRFYLNNGNCVKTVPKGKTGSKNILISKNEILDVLGKFSASCVYIYTNFDSLYHDKVQIQGNTFRPNNSSTKYAVHATNVKNIEQINNTPSLKYKLS